MNRTVMWVTFRQLFTRGRLVTAIVVMVVPFMIAMSFKSTGARTDLMAGKFLVGMYKDFVTGTLLPLVAIVLGTAAFGAEVTDGTIVYLLTKPGARWRVVASKLVVAVLATSLVMAPAVFLPWTIMNHEVIPFSVPLVFAEGIGAGVVLYSALFVALGLTTRKALVYGLLYIVLVEFTLSRTVAGMRSFSVREYIDTFTGWVGAGNRWISPGAVTIDTVWWMGSLLIVGSIAYAINRMRTFELAEKL